MRAEVSTSRRDALYFTLGPALLAVTAVAAFQLSPWPVPLPSQAQLLQPAPTGVVLLLGLVGAWLSNRAGLPSAPSVRDGAAWGRLLTVAVGSGLAFGVALFGIDAVTGLAAGGAKALGVSWINVPAPQSLAHYGSAGVLLECIYRIFPIPLLLWLVGRLMLKGRANGTVFWALALLTSLIEPASLLALARPGAIAALAMLIVVAFAANLFEAVEFRRFGWPAPILFRLAFYGVWHGVGPYFVSTHSLLYPGVH